MSIDVIFQLLDTYRYWVLLPLAFFEGPMVGFVVGVFIALGYLNPIGAYAVLILGDMIPDTLYYHLGRYGKRFKFVARIENKAGVYQNHLEHMRSLWWNHTGKTMFISKLAYGLSTPFLISAGITGLPFKRFFLYAIVVTLSQYAVIMFLGYHFGNSLTLFTDVYMRVSYIIAGVLVLGIVYYIWLSRYVKKRFVEEENGG